ncbi:30S ribosomal protein S13 [Infirmifilum lucidum]|uniref:Small ribosomal subunit protein uS13 n=1 Tax=Infirmifilum lucidum TaxID=2776706 RepID=A0A7L9FHI0_9CREN|nr:30S ribosomal protein S13 [Infirmifilum lucidum]QOJ78376.1 30S ribosomal protein S13 [Infirmifilum lucidum]
MSSEFRYIVRVAGVDLPGDKALAYALADIKGVGVNTAYAVLRKLGFDPHRLLGTLTEEEVEKISNALKNVEALGLPDWMLNRRRDPITGASSHLITSDLLLTVRGDIEAMKKIKSYKGIRHMLGLKVRGQRTRTTGRTGLTVGVRKGASKKQQEKK